MGKVKKNPFSYDGLNNEVKKMKGAPFYRDDEKFIAEKVYTTLCECETENGFGDDIYGSIKKIAVRSYGKRMDLSKIKGIKKDIEKVKELASLENDESAIILSVAVIFKYYAETCKSTIIFMFLGVIGLDKLRYEMYLNELSMNGIIYFGDSMKNCIYFSDMFTASLSNGTPVKVVDFETDSFSVCVGELLRAVDSKDCLGMAPKDVDDFVLGKISSDRFKSFSEIYKVMTDKSVDLSERMFSGYNALSCINLMLKRGMDKFDVETLCGDCNEMIRNYGGNCNAWRKLRAKDDDNFLTRSGIFVHAFLNGQKQYDVYSFSDEFNGSLHKDDPYLPVDGDDNKFDAENIIKCHDIVPKGMYYNDSEAKKIERLEEILDNENFICLQEKLSGKGMRKGFTCIFYGSPGTGKTETVYQLARKTGRDIIRVNVSELKSCWVGESEKNYYALFDNYKMACANSVKTPILLFNEADAIFSKRSGDVSRAVDKMENSLQNILLEGMEKMEGILIATTNLTENFDSAFDRRFLYKVEFKKPCENAKASIWKTMLPELSDIQAKELSLKYDFSGGQIENIARKKVVDDVLNGNGCTFDGILAFCEDELSIRRNSRSVVAGFR